jgi:hypothetical protein
MVTYSAQREPSGFLGAVFTGEVPRSHPRLDHADVSSQEGIAIVRGYRFV